MARTFWLLLAQDIERPVGGVKQIYRLAETLTQLGLDVRVVQGSANFRPSWFELNSKIYFCSLQDFNSTSLSIHADVLVIPETFIPQFFKLPPVPKIIFNQNASYTYGEKLNINPDFVLKVYSHPLLIAVFCVSIADYRFFIDTLCLSESKVFLLVNPIETSLFSSSFPKQKIISYMPRKNRSHSRIILSLLKSSPSFDNSWDLVPISNMSQVDVSSTLKSSYIFLSFGYPEGFGLPIAEALACGCFVVGYDGLGGNELFSLSQAFETSVSISYLDFSSFISSILHFMQVYDQECLKGRDLLRLEVSAIVRTRYSQVKFAESLNRFLNVSGLAS